MHRGALFYQTVQPNMISSLKLFYVSGVTHFTSCVLACVCVFFHVVFVDLNSQTFLLPRTGDRGGRRCLILRNGACKSHSWSAEGGWVGGA